MLPRILILLAVLLISCNKQPKLADYEGTWVAASDISENKIVIKKGKNYSPEISAFVFETNIVDSVKLFFNDGRNMTAAVAFRYDAYYLNLKEKEYLMVYDYKNEDIILSKVKENVSQRFKKINENPQMMKVLDGIYK